MNLVVTPDFASKCFIVRLNRLRRAIDDILDRAEADVKVQHRVAEFLDAGPTVAVIPGQIADQSGQLGAKTGPVFGAAFRVVG